MFTTKDEVDLDLLARSDAAAAAPSLFASAHHSRTFLKSSGTSSNLSFSMILYV